jgi:HPt (histidine-containing phosphotransfer) domain-containing protein
MSAGVIDLERLREMTGGDAEIAAEVLGIFRAQADMWGRMLEPGAGAGTWADACHTIKGAASSVGAMALADACARAEALGKGGGATPAQAGVALSEVKDRLGEAIEAIAVLEHKLTMAQSFEGLAPS